MRGGLLPIQASCADVQAAFPTIAVIDQVQENSGQKSVYRCEAFGGRFVLKLVALPSSTQRLSPTFDDVEARLAREIGLLDKAKSAHLPQAGPVAPGLIVIGAQEYFFYSEEFIPGENMREHLSNNGAMAAAEVADLGVDVAQALDELWSLRVVHRDVKPANIIRDVQSDRFVLIDPGYALALTEPFLTQLGVVVGTAPYLSPEHLDTANKRGMDVRADLYCLGVVMYEAMTGTHPYYRVGMQMTETCHHILNTVPIPPATSTSEDAALAEVIMRLLAKPPHLRYRSPTHLVKHLQSLGKK